MNFIIYRIVICIVFLFSTAIYSQESYKTVVAKDGDGIFSMLKKEGIVGDKYYLEFVAINQDKIKNGTVLQIGKTYKIPNAPDSFKNMGRKILLSQDTETSIFTTEISSLKRKNKALKNTVYYLLFDKFNNDNLERVKNESTTKNEIAVSMAKELLQQGARVFLFDYKTGKNQSLGDYVEAINKRYVKYIGQHQRLLFININQEILGENTTVSFSHYEKSKEGKQFAKNIENMFVSKNVTMKTSEKGVKIFTDKANLYLARNLMPTMTSISVGSNIASKANKTKEDKSKKDFVNIITAGIQNDYTKLSFED